MELDLTKEDLTDFVERIQMGNYKIDSTNVYYKILEKLKEIET